jgi:hypothetical protein
MKLQGLMSNAPFLTSKEAAISHQRSPHSILEVLKSTQDGSKVRSQISGSFCAHCPFYFRDSCFLHDAFRDASRGLYLTRQPLRSKVNSQITAIQVKGLD